MVRMLVLALTLPFVAADLAKTPPMGWMSWEIFRCHLDCTDPTECISEQMYMAQTDALAAGGYIEAGYTGIHMDDCWEQKSPIRTTAGELAPDKARFPSGIKALGDYMHEKGATFGLYTAESATTCAGYPASKDNEDVDAKTFADWGVDYLKVDGCGSAAYYKAGYKAMGNALTTSGRDIVYSCSWPAYINGNNETIQPFDEFIADHCNLWRNYADIQCDWGSLAGIIEHWGQYGPALQPWAGPGHWHDMDMLIIGNDCITIEEERTQMAIWAISASPLIMGNDLRKVSPASQAILLNEDAIAVSQDPLGSMGIRTTTATTGQQIWVRALGDGSKAVGLYNKQGSVGPRPAPPCTNAWTHTSESYYEACGGAAGNVGTLSGQSVKAAEEACCNNPKCVGFSIDANGNGFYKGNAECGITKTAGYDGYTLSTMIPQNNSSNITVDFVKHLNITGQAKVYDIWARTSLGTFSGHYTASAVRHHDTAFLRITPV